MIIADTHVHLHDVFPPAAFFDQARRNFNRAVNAVSAEPTSRILCFTDTSRQDSLARLCEVVRQAGDWRFERRDDGQSAIAAHGDGYVIHLLPGRQIISTENLEILAVDSRLSIIDRSRSLTDLISMVLEAGSVPVLPWGFGKWTGARGALVERIIAERRDFFIAHNGNRCRGIPAHRLFAHAAQRGVPVLSGSDPLPFASEVNRAGSSGIIGTCSPMPENPHNAFRRLLASPGSWQMYGHGVSPLTFMKNQIGMQVRNIPRAR